VEVVIERATLDGRGMVIDLDVVDAALRDAVAAIEGKDLDSIRPTEAEAVTVEILAQWFHARLAEAIAAAGGEALAVRVWESPTAFGGYRAGVPTSSE
jgi:6-pyruvoyl-tetrahydropterin synthase